MHHKTLRQDPANRFHRCFFVLESEALYRLKNLCSQPLSPCFLNPLARQQQCALLALRSSSSDYGPRKAISPRPAVWTRSLPWAICVSLSRWRSLARCISSGRDFVKVLVPRYMPGRMFWVYFVGCALIAASLSIATRIAVRWSGLLVGIMMLLFVAMLYLPFALRNMHAQNYLDDRFPRKLVRRRRLDSCGHGKGRMARASQDHAYHRGPHLIAIAAIFFGVQHFLTSAWASRSPAPKRDAPWVPARMLIDYVTGAALLVTGASILLNRENADGGRLYRRLDFADPPGHLCPRHDHGLWLTRISASSWRASTTLPTHCCLPESFLRWRAPHHSPIETPADGWTQKTRAKIRMTHS